MLPFLFKIGDFELPTFYTMMLIASLVGTTITYRLAKRAQLSPLAAIDISIIGTLMGIFGARIFHIVIEHPGYYLENPTHVWQIWRGGLVWYGGVIIGSASVVAYLKRKKLPILPYIDVLTPALAVVLFFGRVGCFSVGCCFGQPTHLPWGIIFPSYTEAGRQFPALPLHPTQIYEAVATLAIAYAMFRVELKKRFYGQTTAFYLIIYALVRSAIEILRADADRGIFFGVSTSQIISALAIGLGIFLYRHCKTRYPVSHS